MRKAIAVFLLVVFLFNLAGLFVVFKIQKSLIRSEVMQMLQHREFEKELTAITVTAENKNLFEWEHEKEFRYKGVMYDVVKKEINFKGELILHCITDKKETALFTNLAQLVKKNNSSDNALKNLVKLFSSVFLSPAKITVDFFSDSYLIYQFAFAQTPFTEADVLSPPPRIG